MKPKLFWILVLAAGLGLAAAVVNCQGEQEDHSTFEARDPIWNPGGSGIREDFCHDGRDNDGDALADAAGVPPGCTPGVGCLFEADPECQAAGSTGEAECSDNLDNDGDGFWDKTDGGCYLCGYYEAQMSPEAAVFIPDCCDGVDNDCDGDADFADQDCETNWFFEGLLEEKECNDGIDNDGDTAVDLADLNCLTNCDDSEGVAVENIVSGTNGICESTAAPDDVQALPLGQGSPNSLCVSDGNGDNTMAALVGDDQYIPAACVNGVNCIGITSGANGVCNTAAAAGDTQVIPVGQGAPDSICVSPGLNQTVDSIVAGDDSIQ